MKKTDLQDGDVIHMQYDDTTEIYQYVAYGEGFNHFFSFGSDFRCHLTDKDLADATLIVRNGKNILEKDMDSLTGNLNVVIGNMEMYQSQIIDVANALGIEIAESLDGKFGVLAGEAIETLQGENAKLRAALERIATGQVYGFVADATIPYIIELYTAIAQDALKGGSE